MRGWLCTFGLIWLLALWSFSRNSPRFSDESEPPECNMESVQTHLNITSKVSKRIRMERGKHPNAFECNEKSVQTHLNVTRKASKRIWIEREKHPNAFEWNEESFQTHLNGTRKASKRICFEIYHWFMTVLVLIGSHGCPRYRNANAPIRFRRMNIPSRPFNLNLPSGPFHLNLPSGLPLEYMVASLPSRIKRNQPLDPLDNSNAAASDHTYRQSRPRNMHL